MSVAGVAAGVSAAATVAGTAMSMSGSKKAGGASNKGFKIAKKALEDGRDKARADMQPYADVGRAGLDEMAWQLGLPPSTKDYKGVGEQGNLLDDYTIQDYRQDPGFTPMVNTLEELQATPGYQFQLQQGLQSVNNSAAAKGSLLSGNNIKAINDYAQGQASTGYQAAWERAQQAYQNAYNRDTTNKNNRFGRLQSVTGMGQSAAGQQGNYSMRVGEALAGVAQNQGAANASLALYQGQQAQNGITGIGNALTSALTNPGVQSGISSWFGGSGGGYTNDELIGAKINAFL